MSSLLDLLIDYSPLLALCLVPLSGILLLIFRAERYGVAEEEGEAPEVGTIERSRERRAA